MPLYDFSYFPELITERLYLRRIVKEDVADLFVIRSNESAMKYIDRPIATSYDDALNLIKVIDEVYEKKDGVTWAICLKEDHKLIGTIGFWKMDKPNFRAEIGYILNPTFHRKGIMLESLKSVIHFGFNQLNLHSIEANINPVNEASRQILLKLGFVQEAYFRENYFSNGKFLDSAIFSLVKND
ncbi:MAG: GNAT family N-acetyltransferase [Chitinophagaceae bacterium]|nr:GNAT family N-acetyltransferase [Chitinophagaceae bacterium]